MLSGCGGQKAAALVNTLTLDTGDFESLRLDYDADDIHILESDNAKSEPETQQAFKAWVTSFGIGGWLLVLCIQIIQIVIAFIPGEPVEILAGVLYGGFGGLFLCLFGCVIASSGIIPSVISSTFIGSTIRQGEWETAAFIFAFTAVLGVVGIKYQEKKMAFFKRIGRRIKGGAHEEEKP